MNWGNVCTLYYLLQERELLKYMLESDVDNDGILDFQEFKVAIKLAQVKLKSREDSGELSY